MADNDKITVPEGITLNDPDVGAGRPIDSGAGITTPPGVEVATPANPQGGIFHNPGGDVSAGGGPGANVPTPPEQKSATDFLLNQMPHSVGSYLSNTLSAVTHPIDTGNALGNLIAGSFKIAARHAGIDFPENESDQVARAFGNYYLDRYGSIDKAKEALYHDPVGTLSDFSMAAKAAGGVGKLAQLGKAANVASTIGDVLNPAWAATKPVSAVLGHFAPAPAVAAEAVEDTEAAQQAAIRQRAYDLAGQGQDSGVVPGPDMWRQAEREVRSAPPQQAAPPVNPADAARAKMYDTIKGVVGGVGVTAGAEALTKHLTGSVLAGALVGGAIKYIPEVLKSSWGQQALAQIGPGSRPEMIARMARDMVPKLNALYRSQEQKPITLQPTYATGGRVDPELARLQSERLRLPSLRHILNHNQRNSD